MVLTLDGGAFRIQCIVHQFFNDARQIRDCLLGRDSSHRVIVESFDFRRLWQLL